MSSPPQPTIPGTARDGSDRGAKRNSRPDVDGGDVGSSDAPGTPSPAEPADPDGADFAKLFMHSVPTNARLSEILDCLLPPSNPSADFEGGFLADLSRTYSGRHTHQNPFEWTIDGKEGYRKISREQVQLMWPTSFGNLTLPTDGSSPSFQWAGDFPTKLWGAFYSLDPEGEPCRRILSWKGQSHAGLPNADGKSTSPGDRLPSAPSSSLGPVEVPCHGKIWYESPA